MRSSAASMALGEAVSWYVALLLAMMLMLRCCECDEGSDDIRINRWTWLNERMNYSDRGRACDEIYVVREGETLNSISEKCGDPFIVEENPHIHDPDDVFPGLVIKITPFTNR